MNPVKDIDLSKVGSFSDLADQMLQSGGFMAKHLALGVQILEKMARQKGCVNFLSFPAAPVATGLRGVLRELVKRKIFHVIIGASGFLDHDLARSWGSYYEGSFLLDDKALLKKNMHRLGNVVVPRDSYGPLLEKRVQPFLEGLLKEGVREVSTAELCSRLGQYVDDESSILYWAWKNKIPVVLPGPLDGAVGSQIWFFSQRHREFKLNLLKDEEILSDTVFKAKATGALIIGGGITKHHTLWWNQFRGGLDYAAYITTAVEYDGSLSGAQLREAVSWGKVKPKASETTIYGEATVVLPIMIKALLEKLDT